MKGIYQWDGAKLGFQDTGAGLPVVFLHPTPLDRDYWRPLTEDLGGEPLFPTCAGTAARSWAGTCR